MFAGLVRPMGDHRAGVPAGPHGGGLFTAVAYRGVMTLKARNTLYSAGAAAADVGRAGGRRGGVTIVSRLQGAL
eukprot:5795491-Pyramimonas_sp.AAC.1